MQKVRGIGGLFFKCNNPEKLATWYKEHLGFELDAPFSAAFSNQSLDKNNTTKWGVFKNETDYFAPTRQRFMFNLIVDDVQAMLEQVTEAGARQIGHMKSDDNGDVGWFIDPEGFKVELYSPKHIKCAS